MYRDVTSAGLKFAAAVSPTAYPCCVWRKQPVCTCVSLMQRLVSVGVGLLIVAFTTLGPL